MITVDLNKAKEIAHTIRRQKRSEEFAPLDDVIAKQIPGTDVVAVEAQRQAIRDKYAQAQTVIEQSQSADDLLVIVTSLNEQG